MTYPTCSVCDGEMRRRWSTDRGTGEYRCRDCGLDWRTSRRLAR